jgi:hypothetical protein
MRSVLQELVRAIAFVPYERLQSPSERKKFSFLAVGYFQRDD